MENSTLLSPITTMNTNTYNTNSRRNSNASNSPEFEFWSTSSQLQTPLHSADQLFSDGILLPLHRLTTTNPPNKEQQQQQQQTTTQPLTDTPNPDSNNSINTNGSDLKSTSTSSSKRWKDIFKKNPETTTKNNDKKKKKDRTAGPTAGSVGSSTPELNINLWPFSRSRSAGTSGTRPRIVAGNRKGSSAPCSRSNSTGDKYRKWPSSPGRPGVHLGRSSPVWQPKRVGQTRSLHDTLVRNTAEKSSRPTKTSTAGTGVNLPSCMGYREHVSCRSDVIKENGGVSRGKGDVTPVSPTGEGGAAGGMFNFKSLFSKKVF
ncbi:uncharacterized protein [Rutidosis leptorrhynchoides]|uniref:uncharacterized protein n=1 Tax=Rutidosis leptorrhynchoides TaxID=125765 RepID=UPI003A99289F